MYVCVCACVSMRKRICVYVCMYVCVYSLFVCCVCVCVKIISHTYNYICTTVILNTGLMPKGNSHFCLVSCLSDLANYPTDCPFCK